LRDGLVSAETQRRPSPYPTVTRPLRTSPHPMSRRHFLSTSFTIAAFALGALLPSQASAVQPLEQFFDAARVRSFDAREQRVTSEQRDWERGAALGRLLPSFSATGIYQRNQYEVAVQLPGTAQR